MNHNYKPAEKVSRISKKLKKILRTATIQDNYELMMESIEAFAFIHCSWNQIYTDSEIENSLQIIKDNNTITPFIAKETQKKTVIFHDGFGVDMWSGLMYIYVKALLFMGYQVIYIASIDCQNEQPQFKELVKNKNVIFEYYCMNGADRITQAKDIARIINQYKPEIAFLYITPWDTSATLAYSWFEGVMKRYLINATDHTFWIGHSAFDICIEFRNYGAYISAKHRHIDYQKLALLPFYPIINHAQNFEGFPFETDNYKIVFSGGAPYKVYDRNNSFFKLVMSMLEKHDDVIFVYAPKSEQLNCKEVKKKFPTRFFLLEKRRDLPKLLEHVYLYLSTYPITGGLMTQYAVMAGKYPLTVSINEGCTGVLLGDDEQSLYYKTLKELEEDLDRMLDDPDYLMQKEKKIQNRVITEERFLKELTNIIETGHSEYSISHADYDSSVFEEACIKCFNYQYIHDKAILRDEARPELLKHFPVLFLRKEIMVAKKLFISALKSIYK